MSRWYNPVSDVASGRVGRVLDLSRNYEDVARQLRPGEHLYVLADRGLFMQCGRMDNPRDYDEYYSQYARGLLLSFQPVALDERAHQHALQAVI